MEIDAYIMMSLGFLCLAILLMVGGWAVRDVRLKLVGWSILALVVVVVGGHAMWLAWFMGLLLRWSAVVFFGMIVLAVMSHIQLLRKQLPTKTPQVRGLSAELLKSSEPSVLRARR